jgi:hypothetical protein
VRDLSPAADKRHVILRPLCYHRLMCVGKEKPEDLFKVYLEARRRQFTAKEKNNLCGHIR